MPEERILTEPSISTLGQHRATDKSFRNPLSSEGIAKVLPSLCFLPSYHSVRNMLRPSPENGLRWSRVPHYWLWAKFLPPLGGCSELWRWEVVPCTSCRSGSGDPHAVQASLRPLRRSSPWTRTEFNYQGPSVFFFCGSLTKSGTVPTSDRSLFCRGLHDGHRLYLVSWYMGGDD